MKKILLVDDYPDWLEVEKDFIERFNDAECITFLTPLDALVYLRRGNQADIVITDYQMPGMDGFSFAQMLDYEFPDIQIIISSGYDVKELEKIRDSCNFEGDVKIICKDNLEFLKNITT